MFLFWSGLCLWMALTDGLVASVNAFGGISQPSRTTYRRISPLHSSSAQATSTDDLLKPSYDIEPIPVRIGHGFDIHRMAPIEEAGQPVVIGGVTITHKDQKVGRRRESGMIIERDGT